MLTVLIVVALLVALGGTTAGVLIYSNEKRKRLGSGSSTLALPGDVLRERSLKELKVGDVLTIDGKDYLVEGVIEYDEDGHRWVGARVVDGTNVKWCVVGLERVGTAHVRLLDHDPGTDIAGYPPEALVIGDVRFALDKRGNATAKLHGDLGNLRGAKAAVPEGHVERCRWWLYSAPGDDTVVLEQWGADYRVLRGKKVSGDTIDLIPGS
ncbi:MAG: DUF4178 domain-containing protein [Deltaproteobacteria bacterium]|nr:DUF4178 domain-containing protein [Kofleriaceae bacterium]